MGKTKYNDIGSVVQVIGGVFLNPTLLEMEGKYHFNKDDFHEEFHKILFGTIYNMYTLGAKKVTIADIEAYLEQRPKSFAVYNLHQGRKYLEMIPEIVQIASFDYHYKRLKKMTLFRMYESIGVDLKWLYDPENILDVKKRQQQEEWFDATPIEEIADLVDQKMTEIRMSYVDNSDSRSQHAGDGLDELLERLKIEPEIGYPLQGRMFNTILRGARLKKFYLRSAATGHGKSRLMIGDACTIACDEYFDTYANRWISIGSQEPTVYITTEQEVDEIQTMMLAFLSGVNEETIINQAYGEGEEDRVEHAKQIIKRCPIYIEELSNFNMKDIENAIKRNIFEHDVKYVFHDYLHSSLKLLEEVSSRAGVKGLREDNVLFMISTRLKDLCNEYGIFIMSGTQLNAQYVDAKEYDQNLLRGAKSIADKIDAGMIILAVSDEDKEGLKSIIANGYPTPTMKISVYKNRRGRWNRLLVWCSADLGTCRINPLFATDYKYELLSIPETEIKVRG